MPSYLKNYKISICLSLTFLLIPTISISQRQSNKELRKKISIYFQKSIFTFANKLTPYTIYFDTTSKYFYVQIDSNEKLKLDFGEIFIYAHSNIKELVEVKYVLKSPRIDTLQSYFPLPRNKEKLDSNNLELFNKNGVLPFYSNMDSTFNLETEIKYSYILNQMQEIYLYKSLNPSFRITKFDREIGGYVSLRIAIINDTVLFFGTRMTMESNFTFKIIDCFKNRLTKVEARKFLKLLNKIHFEEEVPDCLSIEDGWLIENITSKNQYYILFRDYPFNCTKDFHSARLFSIINGYLDTISLKYFSRN